MTVSRDGTTGAIVLAVRLGRVPSDVDLGATDLGIRVEGSSQVYDVTIPAGRLRRRGRGHYVVGGRGQEIENLKASLVVRRDGGALLHLLTRRLDLSAVEHEDHVLTVTIAVGARRESHTRLWRWKRGRLGSG
jgi:hypothetical protein